MRSLVLTQERKCGWPEGEEKERSMAAFFFSSKLLYGCK